MEEGMNRKTILKLLFVILVWNAVSAAAQTTMFTHRGNLGFAANGNYDFELKLFDTEAIGTGAQQGLALQRLNVTVTNGEFMLTGIDFGAAAFTGDQLFLETGYRVAGGGVFTVLSPREKITAVYANRSLSAATADAATNATQLGGLPASGYIQNTSSQQTGSFNVAGDGTAGGTLSGGVVNAASQYNIGGSRILSTSAYWNLFIGRGAGISNSSGQVNLFVGTEAGYSNTTGWDNTFIGTSAGVSNTTGQTNTFVGARTGSYNTTGSDNSFFGNQAGVSNTSGCCNSFFGSSAGLNNTTGFGNAFFAAGLGNTSGYSNSLFGFGAGFRNNTGSYNSFFGNEAGGANTVGSNNTIIGSFADLGSNNLSNATAIGFRALVAQSHSLVLGSINGVNGANAGTKVGIGITTPSFRLHVLDPLNAGLRVQTNSAGGTVASFAANGDFQIDAPFTPGGRFVVKENGYTGIGVTSPLDQLDVGNIIRVRGLGTGGSTALCRNGSSQIAFCSSSLRYKTDIAPFHSGLTLINRLQPITFNWKITGEADLGFGAEDVARVEPLLVTHNERGEVEGVKYDRIAVVLLNAVKEQQQQIKQQAEQIQHQLWVIEELKKLVCRSQSKADVCKATVRRVAAGIK
jgi:hypothetical protein